MPITTLNSTTLSLRLQLDSNTQTLSTSLKRMSSGLKINSATDGAAEVVISSKLNTRISGMNIAQNNVQQAISMLNCADSSIVNLLGITNRIRELSLSAMNGTYSDSERKVMQDEAEELTKELYRQKNNATFNGIKIFENKTSTSNVEATNRVQETQKPYKVELEYIESTGSEYIDTGIKANFGISCDMDIYLSENPTGEKCMLGSRDASKKRVSLVAFQEDKWAYGYNNPYVSSTSVVLGEKINVKSESLDKSQRIDISYGDVKETVIDQASSRHHNTDLPMYLFAMNYNGTASNKMSACTRLYACKIYENGELKRDYIPVLDNDGKACLYDKVSKQLFYDVNGGSFAYDPNVVIPPEPDPPDTGPPDIRIQVGSKAGIDNTIRIDLGFSLDDIKTNVSTVKDAGETLRAVEKLQKTLLEKQSEIGAKLNRLDGIIDLQNNEIINLNSAKSIIVDTDYASESCKFVKSQILQKVTTSLIGQCGDNMRNLALNLLGCNGQRIKF